MKIIWRPAIAACALAISTPLWAQQAPGSAAARTKNPAALAELRRAIQAQFDRDFPAAISAYEKARTLDPTIQGVDYQLAVVAFNEGKFDAAKASLKKSLEANEEVAASYNLLGAMAGQDKDFPTAAAYFQKAAGVNPGDPNTFFNLSETYREMARPAEAVEALQRAVKLKPRENFYLFKLRLARIANGEAASLEKETEAALKKEKPDAEWLLTAAAIALKRGSYDDAAVLLAHAKNSTEPMRFFAFIQDPAFKAYADKKSIAPFYAVSITPKSENAPK